MRNVALVVGRRFMRHKSLLERIRQQAELEKSQPESKQNAGADQQREHIRPPYPGADFIDQLVEHLDPICVVHDFLFSDCKHNRLFY